MAFSSHKLRSFALIPSPAPTGSLDWSILQDRLGRPRSSAIRRRPPSGVGSGRRGWSSLCHSAFLLVGQPLHSSSFRFSDQQKSCLRPFILFWNENMIIIVQTGIGGRQLQRMKKQDKPLKGYRQRDMKDKNLQALFEDRTRCVHTATMTTQK